MLSTTKIIMFIHVFDQNISNIVYVKYILKTNLKSDTIE